MSGFQENRLATLIMLLALIMVSLMSARYAEADTRESRSDVQRVTMGTQELRILYDPEFSRSERDTLHQWMRLIAGDFRKGFGQLPRDKILVKFQVRQANQPVPWGQVNRESVNEIRFQVDPDYNLDEYLNDWTAYHEFSHLLIPYRGWGDLWLSEGLASYYQNLIQARAGRFTPEQAWHKLLSGLERGQQDNSWSRYPLHLVSDNLKKTRQYMRTHWTGVLFWLTLDVELRKAGLPSLDAQLRALKHCCEMRPMTAQQLAERLDLLSGLNQFERLFEAYRDTNRMPDPDPLLEQLGVERNIWTGSIKLASDASLSHIRDALLTPSNSPLSPRGVN